MFFKKYTLRYFSRSPPCLSTHTYLAINFLVSLFIVLVLLRSGSIFEHYSRVESRTNYFTLNNVNNYIAALTYSEFLFQECLHYSMVLGIF